jgi:serine/threonine protein kinase
MNPTNPNSNRTRPAAPNQPRPDLPHIGRFQVLAELGRGGMGAVYRARDPELNREVAIKVLPAEFAKDPVAKARFLREARAQAAVENEHVVPIYDAKEEAGVAYIVMPLLKGMPLSAALKQNPRPPLAELVRIGREIAEGLAAAHVAGLVHRDIKPGNVWLEAPKRRVKILDFGIARATVAAPGARGDADPLTKRNELLGTPQYMSPEQALSKPVDFRSDLFSLGVVLYQMATGERPFNGDGEFQVMAAVVNEHPASAAEVVPGFPPALADLIDRLLAKDPAARPASAQAVAEELEQVLTGISMRAVVVLPLPDAASDAPNPWAELDTTQGREREPETRRGDATQSVRRAPDPEEYDTGDDTEDEPRTYRAARAGGAPKWLLPAAVVGVLLAVGSVALLLPKGKDKDGGAKANPISDTSGDAKKKVGGKQGKTDPPKVDKVDHERALAEVAGPFAELTLELAGGSTLTVPAGGALPNGPFAVSRLNFQNGPRPPADFRSGTLIPHLAAAGHVRVLLDRTGRLGRWNDDEWQAFCNTKSKDVLAEINVFAPLSDRSLNLVKSFPNLTAMRFMALEADHITLRGLRDLKLESLALDLLGHDVAPVPDVWKGLSELKVRSLFLWKVNGLTPEGAEVLAAAPDLTELGVGGEKLSEGAVLKLLARKELTSVAVAECAAVTDTVCDAIANRPKLAYVELDRVPNVTAKGVAAIREKHPNAKVVWDGNPPVPPKGTEPKTGKFPGLYFDGEQTLVTVPKLTFSGELPLTIEVWATPDSVQGKLRHICLMGRQGSGIGINERAQLGAGLRRTDGKWLDDYSPTPLRAGERGHLAAVFGKGGIDLFVNGKPAGWRAVELADLLKTDPDAVIGGPARDTGGAHFHGTIHALRVSKAERYQRGKEFRPREVFESDADTLALYKFDEGSGTKLTDQSGNKRDGTIVGGKWVTK